MLGCVVYAAVNGVGLLRLTKGNRDWHWTCDGLIQLFFYSPHTAIVPVALFMSNYILIIITILAEIAGHSLSNLVKEMAFSSNQHFTNLILVL